MKKKKTSKKSHPLNIKNQLRIVQWGGKQEGFCFCCGRELSFDSAETGKIKPGTKYSISNARLICKTCNKGIGKKKLRVYMKKNFPKRYETYFRKKQTRKTLKIKAKRFKNQK